MATISYSNECVTFTTDVFILLRLIPNIINPLIFSSNAKGQRVNCSQNES